jgi:hypothetical protein
MKTAGKKSARQPSRGRPDGTTVSSRCHPQRSDDHTTSRSRGTNPFGKPFGGWKWTGSGYRRAVVVDSEGEW